VSTILGLQSFTAIETAQNTHIFSLWHGIRCGQVVKHITRALTMFA